MLLIKMLIIFIIFEKKLVFVYVWLFNVFWNDFKWVKVKFFFFFK